MSREHANWTNTFSFFFRGFKVGTQCNIARNTASQATQP